MEDFTSSNLQLVLGVKEGCHFDRVQKPTIIIATLNGKCLETKKIQPDCNPQYATDLTWETDKNAFRKMRCNQTPIKVESYAVNDNGSREKLGYILLSVRCAQIIHKGEESKIKMNWHNILGVRNEFNNCKPKLMLYLIVKERDDKIIGTSSKDKELQESDSVSLNFSPKWLQEEHLIQLGPLDASHDIFQLNITAETLTDLNKLMEEFKENENNDFAFIYNIFEMFFKLKSFKLESDSIYLNQKIVIKIRTSSSILINYLNSRSHFYIKLKNNNIIVAQSEVNLKSLVTPTYLQDLKQTNKNAASSMDCYCTLWNIQSKECKGDYKRDESDKLPSLKINIKLLFAESNNVVSDINDVFLPYYPRVQLMKNNTPFSNHNYLGEQVDYQNYTSRVQRIPSSEKIVHFNDKNVVKSSVHDKETSTKFSEIYRSYCLNIYLNDIRFLDSRPDVKNIEFRFYHPQGEIVAAICNNVSIETGHIIKLEDVKCKLHFISTFDKIEELLSTFAPKISVCDSTRDERKCIAQVSFDIKKLFCQKKPECLYEAVLIDCHTQNEIGSLGISAVLEDSTMSTLKKINEGTSDTIFDNDLAYKIVDELETWKERQKEIFKEELRKKEELHLTLLNEEWQRRRQCLESKLACSIHQCKMLANNLNKTTEDLRKRKIQSFEKETKLIQANEELQWKYERKLRQLQDALEKMQEEFSLKLRTLEGQNQNLVLQVESLSAKNYELEKVKLEQNEKLHTFQKASLTEDQTTSVLQQLKQLEEKLNNAQKSKSFFKEQWDKAVKEIHKLKMENQKALECQIRSSKEELHNLDLEEILHADSAALTYDQIALNEIRREIEVMKPESNSQYLRMHSKQQLFAPQSDLCLNFDHNLPKSNLSTNSNASERRLNMLMEERDALLTSGIHTSQDDVIKKLNAEIRSLLMNG